MKIPKIPNPAKAFPSKENAHWHTMAQWFVLALLIYSCPEVISKAGPLLSLIGFGSAASVSDHVHDATPIPSPEATP